MINEATLWTVIGGIGAMSFLELGDQSEKYWVHASKGYDRAATKGLT